METHGLGMGFNDFPRLALPRDCGHSNDLECSAATLGNLGSQEGNRYGAYVQATGAWRWSAARSRSVDHLG